MSQPVTISAHASSNGEHAIPFLSVAAPAFNEAAGIVNVVQSWLVYLRGSSDLERFEIVICDDGSADGTGRLLDELAAENPEIIVSHHDRNYGAGVALSAAIKKTRGDWVLLLDSDGQFAIDYLQALVEAIREKGFQAAIGVRKSKRDTLFSRFGTRASGMICNWIYRTSYRDFNSAFKLVRGPLLRSIRLEASGFNYSTEVTSRLAEQGIEFAEVDIEHLPRREGASKMRMARGAMHRFLFVSYLALRQILLRMQILRKEQLCC